MILTYNGKWLKYNEKIIAKDIESPIPSNGYWIHKDTGVVYNILDSDSAINGVVFNSPLWKDLASEVSIPSGIKFITSGSFSNSPNLVTFITPDSVEQIGDNTLTNTPKLENIYIYSQNPPTLSSLGTNVGNFATQIKVQAESFDSYRLANGWSQYYGRLFVLNDLIPGSRVHDGYTYRSNGIDLSGQSNIVIENYEFDENTQLTQYQWQRGAILLSNCNNIIIRNCKFKNLSTRAFSINDSSNIKIYNCDIHECWHACTFNRSKGSNQIFSCDIRNVIGVLTPERSTEFGNAVQFMLTGDNESERYLYGNNRAQDLAIDNVPGYSEPEDVFSNYRSWHNPNDPYIIRNNRIRGGSMRTWGVSLQLNDNGGSGVLVEKNTIVNAGTGGVSIAGGHDVIVNNNILVNTNTSLPTYAKALQSWIYVPDEFPVNNRTMSNNRIYWNNQQTPYSIGSGVSTPIGFDSNIWRDQSLSESVLPQHIIGIRKGNLEPTNPFNPPMHGPLSGGTVTLTNNASYDIDADSPFVNGTLFFVMEVWPLIRTITVPEGITNILGKALQNQRDMTFASFPSTTIAIGEQVFTGATSLTTIHCKSLIPPRLDIYSGNDNRSLGISPSNVSIYVPASAVDIYKNTQIWQNYTILPL